jgi:nitrogen-specific signal transduction histidine kinase
MNDKNPPSPLVKTHFAPSGRDESVEFLRKIEVIKEILLLREVLNAMPSLVMILNSNRQIVSANQAVLRTLNVGVEDILEKRPGEALGCIRSKNGPDGCGTSSHCVTCGAVNAILESQNKDVQIVRECRILVDGPSGPSPLDVKVTATPITVKGERFIVAAIDDISQTKRLEVLQRVFFHDVMNTAHCISGFTQFLTKDPTQAEESSKLLQYLSEELIEEINAQRDLLAAEAGDLSVVKEPVIIPTFLNELRLKYLNNPEAEERKIDLCIDWDGTIQTDRRLLRRVLGNMLKNGLEATSPGQTVTMKCSEQDDSVVLSVHNCEIMPEEIQLQIFQRSFSTKSQSGRGIGTYSIKLLSEQYLGGHVDFTSKVPEGTSFLLTIPKGDS